MGRVVREMRSHGSTAELSVANIRRQRRSLGIRNQIGSYLFLLPALLFFLVFTIYPIFYSLTMSFTNWQLVGHSHFVGAKNYVRILHDPVIGTAFKNTFLYGVISVPVQLLLGLGVALALDRPLRGRALFRILYYLPVITSWVVVSILFEYLFNTDYGLVNWILMSFHLISDPIAWLASPTSAIIMLSILGAWKGIGWAMLIFLAGLQSVPVELYEAATVDGASRWQQFRYVTMPGIRNTFLFVTVLLVIGAFNVFISVFIVTGGGPANSTQVLLTWMYNAAFQNLDFAYASALSWFIAGIIVVVSVVQFRLFRPNREKEV